MLCSIPHNILLHHFVRFENSGRSSGLRSIVLIALLVTCNFFVSFTLPFLYHKAPFMLWFVLIAYPPCLDSVHTDQTTLAEAKSMFVEYGP